MANFLDILNAVTASLGGLAQITNQQAKEREQRDLEGAKLLAQLKDYEFAPAQNIQRPGFFDAMRGIQGTADGQRVVNVGGQPFIVRQRQTLGERMPSLFAPQPETPKVPLISAVPAQPSIQLGQAEPVVGYTADWQETTPHVPGEGIAGLKIQRDRLARIQQNNTLGQTQRQNIGKQIARLDEEITALSGEQPAAAKLPEKRLEEYAPLIIKYAQENGIDPALLFTIAQTEKSGVRATSPKQARGLMQIIDDTWNAYAKGTPFTDPFNAEHSIGVAARYVKDLVGKYGENRDKIFAAYNAGEPRVDAANGVPNIDETKKYVQAAQQAYPLYQRMFGAQPSTQTLAATTGASALPSGIPSEGYLGRMPTSDGKGFATVRLTGISDERINNGRETNIPLLVPGQVNVQDIVDGKPPTRQQLDIAITHAQKQIASGHQFPSYDTPEQASLVAKAESDLRGRIGSASKVGPVASVPFPSGTVLPPLPQPPKPMGDMPTFDRNELLQYVMNDPFVQELKKDRSTDAIEKLRARTVQLQTEFRAEKRLDWQQKMDLRRQEWDNYRALAQQRTSALSEESQRRIQNQMIAMQQNRDATQDRLLAESARRDEKEFHAMKGALLRDISAVKDPQSRADLLQKTRATRPGEQAVLSDIRGELADLGPTARYDAVTLRHQFEREQALKLRAVDLVRKSPLSDPEKEDWVQRINAAESHSDVLGIYAKIPSPAKVSAITPGAIAAGLNSEYPEEARKWQGIAQQYREFIASLAEAKQRVSIDVKAQLSSAQGEAMEKALEVIASSRGADGRIPEDVAGVQQANLYQAGLKKPAVDAIMTAAGVAQQRQVDELSRKNAAARDLHQEKAQGIQDILSAARQVQGEQGVDLVNEWFARVEASRRVDGTPDPNIVTQGLAALGAAKMPTPVLTMFAEGVGAKAAEAANKAIALLPPRLAQAQQVSGVRLDEMDHRFAQTEGFKLQQKLLRDVKTQSGSDADRDMLTSKILAVDVQQDPTAPAQLLALSTQVQGPVGTQNRMAFASALAGVELKIQQREPLSERDKQILMTEKIYRDRLDMNLTSTEILARAMDALEAQRRGDPLDADQQRAINLYRRYTLELNPTSARLIAGQISSDPETAMQAEVMRHVELKQLGEDAAEKATQTFLHGPVAEATKDKLVRLGELQRALAQLASFPKEQRDKFVGMFDMPAENLKSALGQAAETLGFRGEKGSEEASAAFQKFRVALNQVKLLSAFKEGGKQLTGNEELITFGFVVKGDETPAEFASKLIFNMSGVDYVLKMNLALSTAMRRDLNNYSDFIKKTMQDNADEWGMRKIIPGFPARPTTTPQGPPPFQPIQPRLPVQPVPRVTPMPVPRPATSAPPVPTQQGAPVQRQQPTPSQQPVRDIDEDFVLPSTPKR